MGYSILLEILLLARDAIKKFIFCKLGKLGWTASEEERKSSEASSPNTLRIASAGGRGLRYSATPVSRPL